VNCQRNRIVLALSLASPGSLLKLFFQYYRARCLVVAGAARRPAATRASGATITPAIASAQLLVIDHHGGSHHRGQSVANKQHPGESINRL
jgi:hypothetical protein